jgi:hypothetical protein
MSKIRNCSFAQNYEQQRKVHQMELWQKAGVKPQGAWYQIYEK